METKKRYHNIYKAGYSMPIMVIREENGKYEIHRLFYPGYLLRGVFTDWDECMKRVEEIAMEY